MGRRRDDPPLSRAAYLNQQLREHAERLTSEASTLITLVNQLKRGSHANGTKPENG